MAVTAIATVLLFIATLLLFLVGRFQLRALNKTNEEANRTTKEVFLNNLKEVFFTETVRDLMLLIENDSLQFEVKVFSTTDGELQKIGIFSNTLTKEFKDYLIKEIGHSPKNTYTSHEMDDFLLQHFEDLGLYFVKKIINSYDTDQAFGYYIDTVYECPSIQKYIECVRKDDTDIYSNFELLYKQLQKLKDKSNK